MKAFGLLLIVGILFLVGCTMPQEKPQAQGHAQIPTKDAPSINTTSEPKANITSEPRINFSRKQGDASNLQYCYVTSDCVIAKTNCCPDQTCGQIAINKAFSDYWNSTYDCSNQSCPDSHCVYPRHADCVDHLCTISMGEIHNPKGDIDPAYRPGRWIFPKSKPTIEQRIILGNITDPYIVNQTIYNASPFTWYVKVSGCEKCSEEDAEDWSLNVAQNIPHTDYILVNLSKNNMSRQVITLKLTSHGMDKLSASVSSLNVTSFTPYKMNNLVAEIINTNDSRITKCTVDSDCSRIRDNYCNPCPEYAINKVYGELLTDMPRYDTQGLCGAEVHICSTNATASCINSTCHANGRATIHPNFG